MPSKAKVRVDHGQILPHREARPKPFSARNISSKTCIVQKRRSVEKLSLLRQLPPSKDLATSAPLAPKLRLYCGMSTPSRSFSIPSIIALVTAILSFTSGAIMGLILACVAILFGALGIFLSVAPNVRGGIVSTLSIAAGAIGIVAAVIKAIMWLF